MTAPEQVIYMDNNATTRVAPEVLDATVSYKPLTLPTICRV